MGAPEKKTHFHNYLLLVTYFPLIKTKMFTPKNTDTNVQKNIQGCKHSGLNVALKNVDLR